MFLFVSFSGTRLPFSTVTKVLQNLPRCLYAPLKPLTCHAYTNELFSGAEVRAITITITIMSSIPINITIVSITITIIIIITIMISSSSITIIITAIV